ncbi:MAG TPA: ATP-binding protein [Gemmatimonadales bacterium]|nr:ATP-binding protein [Gemmatimonadales bacterium]
MDDILASPLRLCVRRSGDAGSAPAVSVLIEVPADVRFIEDVIELMARHCFSGTAPCKRTGFRLRVLLAEALTNSILFGAEGNPQRTVRVGAELTERTIRLEVTDDGPGFDPREVPDPTAPTGLGRAIGRGLFLIRNLADRVEFNEQGNTIWMTLPRS